MTLGKEIWRIEAASTTQAPLLASLSAACFDPSTGEGWSANDIEALLQEAHSLCLIAWSHEEQANGNREAIGFVLGRRAADEAELLLVGVTPRWRRRGLAHDLLHRFVNECRSLGLRQIHLEMRAENSAAQALYKGHNFIPVGRRRGYYRLSDGRRADALTMRYNLPQA